MARRRQKLTAMKAAALIGTITGASVYLTKSGLSDPGVVSALTSGEPTKMLTVFTNPNIFGNAARQSGAVVSAVVAASTPPLAVALTKKVISLVKGI